MDSRYLGSHGAALHNLECSAGFQITGADVWRAPPEIICELLSSNEHAIRYASGPTRIELLDNRDCIRTISPQVEAAVLSVLPASVTRLGLRFVGPDQARLPEIPGAETIFDPCGRWPTIAGASQMIVETGGTRPVATVHADGDVEHATEIARGVIGALSDLLRRI
jgi:hypothetical protein